MLFAGSRPEVQYPPEHELRPLLNKLFENKFI